MNRKINIIVIVISFTLSYLVASYLSNNRLNLSSTLKPFLELVNKDDTEILLVDEPIEPNISKVTKPNHIQVNNLPTCKDTSIGKIKYKKVNNVYIWIDDNGIENYSDKPPITSNYQIYNYAGRLVYDYFSLNLQTSKTSSTFRTELENKITKVFKLYGYLLDKDSLRKVEINQRIYNSPEQFYIDSNQYGKLLASTTGFYTSSNNQASILFTTTSQTINTAVHEATHAINRGVIGLSNKWLNEGLSEYKENISTISNSINVVPNTSWTRNSRFIHKPLSLIELFNAPDADWNSEKSNQLYASSWGFIYYMMENPMRKSVLAQLIKREQLERCNKIDLPTIESILNNIDRLEIEFQLWASKTIKTHSI